MSQRQVTVLLGFGQLLAWGSSFYLLAILAEPMAAGLALPRVWVYLCFSASLVMAAVLGPLGGQLIDRHGGRPVLMAGNVVFALALLLMSQAQGGASLMLGWLLLGVAMPLGLYDAGFATAVRLFGAQARRSIVGITLIAGFASSVSWPLTHWLEQRWDWRVACQSLAVLLIDVDHFKAYNDHYGHVAGDQCLQRVADALKASLNRPMDRVGRYGGEEFMAIAYPVSGAGVVDLANRVREAVELLDIPHAASPSGERITVSVGVTCVPPRPGLEPDKLIDLADKALYRAKTAGRNCVEICGPEPAPIRPGGQKVSAIRPTQPATPRP